MTQPTEAVRYAVFRDKKGNRFVFPTLCTYQDKHADRSLCSRICLALNVEQEHDTFDVIPDESGMVSFTRVVAEAGSSGFRHGRFEVWLISGPEFDSTPDSEESP